MERLIRWVACAVLVALPVSWASAAEDYGYPLRDRFLATVVGTPAQFQADLPEDIPFRSRTITIFEEREAPDALFFDQDMRYSAALQRGRAPVMFLIAGTGAAHNGGKNVFMAKAFYEQGFHVISLSSPTFLNFVTSASATGVPGHAQKDAEDLYRAMQKVVADLGVEANGFHLTGYSLGGFNAAFVAHLDQQKQVFDFERVLLINPPYSVYNSISLLDRMIENIPGGEDNFSLFFDRVVRTFSDVYQRADSVDFGEEFLVAVFSAMQPKDEELAALIGLAFRLSSSSMLMASDIITDYGFVKPKGVQVTRVSDLTEYRQVVTRIGFTDFYHEFFYPFYKDDYPGMGRDDFINSMSLATIADFLRDSPQIKVMHNEDDVILEPGEINFFRKTFGDRAKIYPVGGHLGNMQYRDNVAHMVGVFK
jgi:hypothetical protein